MSLPPELIQEIIDLLLFSAPPRSRTPEDPGCSTKPTWGTINALSLTSQSYRALVLETWFRTLYIKSPGDLIFLRNSGWLPELGSKWTRHLHCVQTPSRDLFFWDLSCFLHLSSIRLDWLSPNFTPSFYSNLSKSLVLPFFNLLSSVEHLDLRGFWWPIPGMLQSIPHTSGLRHLKTLKMKQETSWCALCGGCYEVRFKDRPIGVVYEGGYGLPIDYARVLTPLEYLEEVVITVPNHGSGSTTVGHTPIPHVNSILNLWSGECRNCMKTKYKDDGFRQKWTDRKMGIGVCRNGRGEKDTRPPKLRRVEWRFSF